jgi:carnosine N-methyltransferase
MGNNGPTDDVEEKEHFQRIVNAFRYYRFDRPTLLLHSYSGLFSRLTCFHPRSFSLQRLATSEAYVSSLPSHHQTLLTSYRSHLEDIRTCVEHNYEIIKLITADVATLFENVKHDAGQVCFP